MQAHLGAQNHEGVAHVVPGVAHVGEADALAVAEVLLNGQQIRQHLGGVEFIGEAVPNGNTGVMGQVLHSLLAEAAVFNAVEHAAQNPGGVSDGLFLAHLGAAGVQIGDAQAQVPSGYLEGATGAGGGLFK